MISHTNHRLAVVKSAIYQDLWVTNKNNAIDVFKTSLMRGSPIGLMEYVNTEFIIVKDSHEYPCKEYPYVTSPQTQQTIQYNKENKYPDLPFLDQTYHKDVTIDEISRSIDEIEWNQYTIVLTINACIPDRIIEKYPDVLWCYYVGENDPSFLQRRLGQYDVLLDQNSQPTNPFSISFPYTFLGPHTLETLYNSIDVPQQKHGIYMEINNTQERPVQHIPDTFQYISQKTNLPIHIHQQNIIENLRTLYQSKYFIKLHGRQIRGNAAVEAISCGTLVIMNKSLIMYDNLIQEQCHVETPDDVISRIRFFEENEEAYQTAVALQRRTLEENYAKIPLQNLFQKYEEKQQSKT